MSLSLKKGNLNYSVDNVNAFASLNGVGMGYGNGDFSINGKMNYSGRYSLNGAYNDKMLSASLGYGQKGVNINAKGNKHGVSVNITHTF